MLLWPGALSAQWVHEAEVRRTTAEWMASWRVPGVAVAVIRNGDVLLLEGFGVRRLAGSERVDAGTPFELGSAAKTFTATAAALLVDDGAVRWDSPLADVLPGFRWYDEWAERRLTLMDGLAHRTGVRRHDVLWLGGATPVELQLRLRRARAATGFREAFSYSNLTYVVIGEALAALSGQPWSELLSRRILDPLGMERAGAGDADVHGAAHPHVQIGDTLLAAATPHTHVGPAGGVHASAADLVPWMRFHLEATGAVRDLRAPRVPLSLDGFRFQYPRSAWLAYGMGWFVSDYAGRQMVDHIGGHGGMVARITLLPDDGIGVAVLTNHGDNLLPVSLTHRILDLLLGLEEREWNDELLAFWGGERAGRASAAAAVGGERDLHALPRLPLAAYAGTYESAEYGATNVIAAADGLLLRYGSNLVGRLAHWRHDTFQITWTDPFLRAILGPGFASFELDMQGRPARITWTGLAGELIEAERSAGGR
jgi:CubicO group peptidase (beta-lactamase class C family)